MERRASDRVETNIVARLFCDNLFHSETVKNVSDDGMFINTKRLLPTGSIFVVIFRLENELLSVIAKVKRLTSTADNRSGIGATLVNPSRKYLEFIHSKKLHKIPFH